MNIYNLLAIGINISSGERSAFSYDEDEEESLSASINGIGKMPENAERKTLAQK